PPRALPHPLTQMAHTTDAAAVPDRDEPPALQLLRHRMELTTSEDERTTTGRRLAAALASAGRHPEALRLLRGLTEASADGESATHTGAVAVDALLTTLAHGDTAAEGRETLVAGSFADAHAVTSVRHHAALLALREALVGENPRRAGEAARTALTCGLHPADDESGIHGVALLVLGWAGEPGAALDHADSAVACHGHLADRPHHLAHALTLRASLSHRLGRLDEARADASAALDTAAGAEPVQRLGTCPVLPTAVLVEALVDLGRLDEAERALTAAGAHGALDGRWGHDHTLFARARLHAARGRLADAAADFAACGARGTDRGTAGPLFHRWRSGAALVRVGLGDSRGARTLAAEERELALASGVPELVGHALRVDAAVSPGEAALDRLREAVELLRETGAQLWFAEALVDLGRRLAGESDASAARAALREALDVARECGAEPVASAAARALGELGDRPRARAFHGYAALTPAELRVARLAADGMTNRQIAGHLFVSLRTVEMHLTNTYAKLDSPGRRGLAAALAAGAPASPRPDPRARAR
ncbi:helix-turn-helix transcriptional regulator, partial [Streptomyces alkaliterrae]